MRLTYPVIRLGQIMSRSSDGDACGYHMMEAELSWTCSSNGGSAARVVLGIKLLEKEIASCQ